MHHDATFWFPGGGARGQGLAAVGWATMACGCVPLSIGLTQRHVTDATPHVAPPAAQPRAARAPRFPTRPQWPQSDACKGFYHAVVVADPTVHVCACATHALAPMWAVPKCRRRIAPGPQVAAAYVTAAKALGAGGLLMGAPSRKFLRYPFGNQA